MDLLQEIRRDIALAISLVTRDRKLAQGASPILQELRRVLHGSVDVSAKEIRRQDEQLERPPLPHQAVAARSISRAAQTRGIEGVSRAPFHEILRDEVEHKDAGARSLVPLNKK